MAQQANIVTALRQSISEVNGLEKRFAAQTGNKRLSTGIRDIDRLLGGGLALNELHEIRCSLSRDIGCAAGFILGLLAGLNQDKPAIWVSDPSLALDTGALFPDGLIPFGFDASRMIHITPLCLSDAFWATGEAARTNGLAATVFHIKGNPLSFDLSISRKLMLRAQTGGTPLFILRQASIDEASSAATRWHVEPAPSLPDATYHKGVGQMRLRLTLEKNRNGQTGQWPVAWNPKTRSFEHAAKSPASTHSQLSFPPSVNGPHRPAALGQAVALERAS